MSQTARTIRALQGKRCEALGARPGNICEPAVGSMSVALSTHKVKPSGLTLSQEEVAKVRASLELIKRTALSRDRTEAKSPYGATGFGELADEAHDALAILDKVEP